MTTAAEKLAEARSEYAKSRAAYDDARSGRMIRYADRQHESSAIDEARKDFLFWKSEVERLEAAVAGQSSRRPIQVRV
jgi:hypothetical protein